MNMVIKKTIELNSITFPHIIVAVRFGTIHYLILQYFYETNNHSSVQEVLL